MRFLTTFGMTISYVNTRNPRHFDRREKSQEFSRTSMKKNLILLRYPGICSIVGMF
jgi:hypothetical protein